MSPAAYHSTRMGLRKNCWKAICARTAPCVLVERPSVTAERLIRKRARRPVSAASAPARSSSRAVPAEAA